jgi:protein-disulfide isomerase
MNRPLRRVLVSLLFVVPLLTGGMLTPSIKASQDTELDKRFLQAWNQQPRVTLLAPPGPGKVVIVKFNDWMCPGCKYWYDTLRPVLAQYQRTPGAIKYVEKDWPWNSGCNDAVNRTIPGHEASCFAAAAVRLATEKGKRDQMIEWLYGNQPETPASRQTMPDRVKAKTTEMLGIKDFSAAYAAKLPEIKKDIAEGIAVQIQSTPTYFVNGIRAANPDNTTIALHFLELGIQEELKKKAGK